MGWESTALYYRLINEGVRQQTNGDHAARIVLYSVDFHDIHTLQATNEWDAAGAILADAALHIENAGADCLLICTNTMHVVAPAITAAIKIPILHLADVTVEAILRDGNDTVGLLGTRFTMEKAFYKDHLSAHKISSIVPGKADRNIIHDIIYDELVQGIVRPQSRAEFLRIIDGLASQGAQGVISGCTEISMIIQQEHIRLPLYDTTHLHARAAVRFALG